jgi:hypothetical protein
MLDDFLLQDSAESVLGSEHRTQLDIRIEQSLDIADPRAVDTGLIGDQPNALALHQM